MLGALDGPIINAATVTPSNSTVISVTRGLYVGGAGNVSVTMGIPDNNGVFANVVFTSVPGGVILPVRVRKVLTDTSATNIVALY